jgi:hypothetical protein
MSARIIICGSRNWADRERIADRLYDLEGLDQFTYPITIVHGNAKGADRIAHQEAQKLGLLVEPHPYQPFISPTVSAKRAPLERNTHMAALGADLCIAFWDGRSTGTRDMLDKAEAAGIPVEVIT